MAHIFHPNKRKSRMINNTPPQGHKPVLKPFSPQPKTHQKNVSFRVPIAVTAQQDSQFKKIPPKKRWLSEFSEVRGEDELLLQKKRPRHMGTEGGDVIDHGGMLVEPPHDRLALPDRSDTRALLTSETLSSISTGESSNLDQLLSTVESKPDLLAMARNRQIKDAMRILATEQLPDEVVNARDEQGRSPLMWAAMTGQYELGNAMLKQGALVNDRDRNGVTPLMWSLVGGSPRLFNALMDAGADVHARDQKMKTSLMWAAAQKRPYMLSQLLERQVNPHLEDYKGYKVVDYAINSGNLDCLKIILDRVYAKNPLNQTIMNMAASLKSSKR
jgi:hypothetical protein